MDGLDFLADAMGELNDNQLSGKVVLTLPIDSVFIDPDNPRKEYDQEYIKELAASIDKMGLIQPIVVREIPGEEKRYYCNVGSNRVLAVKWLKENKPDSPNSSTIEAVLNNNFHVLGKLVENIQRNDLKPLEIAKMLKDQMDLGVSSKDLQEQLGKDKTWISRHISLNDISEYTMDLVENGRISNVEAILNFDKIYKSNEHYATCLIANLGNDEKLSNGLSRKWIKNLKDKNTNPEKPLIEDEHTEEVLNSFEENKAESVNESDANSLLVDEVKLAEEALADDVVKKKEKKQKAETTGFSPELRNAFKEGLEQSYTYLLDVVQNSDSERKALAKQILVSLSCNDHIAINWLEVAKHADLMQEMINIFEAFKAIGYVSPLNHPSQEMVVVVSQEQLL